MGRPDKPVPIRRGGIATPYGYLYELSGGELCLDFANTVDSRPTERRRDLIPTYGDLLTWGVQAEVLSDSEAKTLRRAAVSNAPAAEATLEPARELRETLFELFAAVANGEPPPGTLVSVLNEFLPAAYEQLHLISDGAGCQVAWKQTDALDRVLWPVVRSAVQLLTSNRLDRVRECAAKDCRWLFMDQSRNRSRRWCDMTVCGNRDKIRRFRAAHNEPSAA